MSLRTVVLDVPPQDIITRDNVSVKVNAVVYFRVLDPSRAVVEVENYMYATSQLAQTTLRSVLGQAELDDLLAQRDRLNQQLQQILDSETEPWGIKVSSVEVKHVDLPQDMQRAMARQAEAEREKRAKIIHAEGELIASDKLAQAAGDHRRAARRDDAALSADADRDCGRAELDHHLPAADRVDQDAANGEVDGVRPLPEIAHLQKSPIGRAVCVARISIPSAVTCGTLRNAANVALRTGLATTVAWLVVLASTFQD